MRNPAAALLVAGASAATSVTSAAQHAVGRLAGLPLAVGKQVVGRGLALLPTRGGTAAPERTAPGRTEPAPAPGDLPITGFDSLTNDSAERAIDGLDDPAEVRAVLAYEQEHKGRDEVLAVAEEHLAELESDTQPS